MKVNIPDVTAYPLDQAEEILKNNKVKYNINNFLLYFLDVEEGSHSLEKQHYRVLRQHMNVNVLELVIAPESY